MAPLLIVLFLVTFPFDTRVGLCFLAAAIVVIYRGGPAKRRKAVVRDDAPERESSGKDPWETKGLD